MESLGMFQKEVQSKNKWRRIRGQPANPGSSGKYLKMECVIALAADEDRGVQSFIVNTHAHSLS